MTAPLRVLNVEDSADDTELLRIQLGRAGFDVSITRVDSAEAFSAALDRDTWDLVIADHSMPTFDAPQALALRNAKHIDLPFLMLSGTISDVLAIELMREGAHDFVPKDDPSRLEPIIHRELREAENRRGRRRAETEREATLAQLHTANRTKDEFLSMLGHEFRNPLAPIVSALELVRQHDDGRSTRELNIIDRHVRHMLSMVDDLLDVVRITQGTVELELHTVEIALALQKALATTALRFEQKKQHLRVDVRPHDLQVNADEARLVQIVVILLTNATQYTPAGGEVSLTAVAEGDEFVIRVCDNGVGIELALEPKIFDLFAQGARSFDRSAGGLGLGLALVRNLVELHGGSVAMHSGGRDRGSEFTVRLPAASFERAASAPLPLAPVLGLRRLLLVDDNVDAVEMLAELLRSEDHEVEVATNGSAALELLERYTPSLMVVDIGLPGMDGYELAKRIRDRPDHHATPLIALTGFGQASDFAKSKKAGFALHLVKPVNLTRLFAAVQSLLVSA